jgi:hypothetical protein
VVDADLGQAVVHGPLQPVRGGLHVGLDEVEQSGEVEAVGPLRHPFGGQCPPGTRDHGIRIGEPGQPQFFGVRVLLHHVVHEPVVHLGRACLAEHGVQLRTLERLRAADQQGQQSRRGVAGVPELTREILLGLQPLRDRA